MPLPDILRCTCCIQNDGAFVFCLCRYCFSNIGSITGSIIGSFLYIASSEWWLRFLDDSQTYLGVNIPFMRGGFRMVVFSVVIMLIVLFYRQGIMGTKEFSWQGIIDFFKKPFAKRKRKAVEDNG